MKNTGKNQSSSDSYGVSEAGTLLGVSIPTLKRMVTDGTVDGFRTPGGHLRITADSIDAMKNQRQARARPVREASPVLQNRRERLEELNIEAQEVRARRELAKLQREEHQEAEQREAEAQAREEEAAQRHAAIELERQRFAREKAQERRRMERERLQEQQRREAEQQLAAFRQRWYDAAAEAVVTQKLAWLAPAQRKEVTDALDAEIERRQPADEPRMGAIIARSLDALLEPLRAERDAQERRQRLTNEALWSLPYSTTEAEKVKAMAAIREALGRFDSFADVSEMRVAAKGVVQPFRQAVERRQLEARLIAWALRELPWSRTDGDEARIRRECAEVLERLPLSITEAKAKEALETKVTQARRGVEKRQADEQRQARRAGLIQQGLAEVSTYLVELKREGEIADEDFYDPEFTADIREAVQRGLEAQLSGAEKPTQLRKLAREIIDGELE